MKNAWVVFLAPWSMAMMCGPPPDGPTPDSDVCRTPAETADVTQVLVRSAVTDATLVDGGELPITVGGQGTDMIGIQLEVHGTGVPSCLAQSTTIVADGSVIAESATPLNMHESAPGVWRSGDLWLFPDGGGGEAVVTTTAYGAIEEVTVSLMFR